MKKYWIIVTVFFASCSTAPEKYFDQALLNSNMMVGFAGNGMERELEQPSAKLVEGSTEKTEPMKRKEVIENKIKFMEEAFGKVKELSENNDTKEILQASRALYELVLPVYKTEYVQLAKLYDDNAPKEQIEALQKSIHDSYASRFEALYAKLIAAGKPYAAKHNINVRWSE